MKISAERFQILLTALCGILLVVSFLTLIPGLSLGGADAWAWAAVVCGAYFAVRSAWESLKEKSLDVNLLMVMAAVGAIVVGHVEDAAVLLFLFSLSSTLEAMAMGKTMSAIEALVKLRPDQALRIGEGGDERVRVEELKVGDVVRVLPFEPIPSDGKLLSDRASVDEAAMTGESQPVEVPYLGNLMAGTQNLDSMITMSVTHEVGESSLDKIVGLVQEAQENKASGERISKWFGERYTIFVVGAFLLSLVVRTFALGMPSSDAFYASLILLVALSPCALVISSPAAALSALAYAARRGALVRGGQYIEEIGKIDTVLLDKTGTLTAGRPQVVEICMSRGAVAATLAGKGDAGQPMILCWHSHDGLSLEAREALTLAASAEQFSTHPIAESIVSFAKSAGITIPEAERHDAFAGLGVEADVKGSKVKIGQLRFFEADNLPGDFREHVEEMRTRGLTAVLMLAQGEWTAIGLRDEPRPTSEAFVRELRAAGVTRIAMLTGDNKATAEAVAQEVGISEVHAGLLPADKQKLVSEAVERGDRVMMIGDGINDAPALTAAHLGVAMGGLGSEVALRSADLVLVQDRLERLPEMIRLGRMTNKVIRANLLFAAGVILVLTLASFFARLPLPIAVIGHEGSTVLVILNGLRLLRGPGSH